MLPVLIVISFELLFYQLIEMHFKDKVVLITGTGSGIGAATAEHFAKLGAKLVLVDINVDTLNDTVVKIKSLTNVEPLVLKNDVTTDAKQIIDKTISFFGQLDILVNNVGRSGLGGIETVTLQQYEDIMNLNVRSMFTLTKLAVPFLIKTKGNIINVSCFGGIRPLPNFLVYCMSKTMVDQFTRCIALELAPKGVRVNSVNPGAIVTNMYQTCSLKQEAYQQFLIDLNSAHPLGRVGAAGEVASSIVFLANDKKSSFVTGTLLSVDGGRAISHAVNK